MKKYLMTAAAALALGGIFSGCTKDTDFSGSGGLSQDPIKNYEEAFISTFGRPVDGLDWGFGSGTIQTNTRAFTRALPTFPSFRDSSCPSMPTKYSNSVPSEAEYAKDYQNYQKGDVIYIDTKYQQLNNPQNTDNLTIYVDGNVAYYGSTSQNDKGTTFCVTEGSTLKLGSVSERLTIYLAPNATLDLSESYYQDWGDGGKFKKSDQTVFTFTKDNAALYMSSGSKVICPDLYFKDGYTVLNEGGTIEVGDLHVENGAILYNKNKVKATGVIALRNTNGEIDNFSELEGGSMTLDANARFYNVPGGEVHITGLTKLNNDSGTNAWQNSGHFYTGSFEITGGCQDPAAFNNCYMYVTNQFHMNHGNFVLDGGAAVECGSYRWDSDNYFYMGSKALLNVKGQLIANNANSSPHYGFHGEGDEYAVIQAGSVVKLSEGKYRAAYYGKLFIDTDDHFAQGRSSADGAWYYFDNTVKFSFTDRNNHAEGAVQDPDFSITIPADPEGCTPGYSGGGNTGGGGGTTGGGGSTTTVRVIAEDLNLEDTKKADFDFNDVVFDVEWSGSQLKITLQAAGGTLPLTVGDPSDLSNPTYETDQSGFENLKYEVHRLYKVSTRTMVNTQAAGGVDRDPVSFIIDNPRSGETDLKVIANYIPIRVYKGEKWVELPVATTVTRTDNLTACKLGVDGSYSWCTERSHIDTTFPYIDSRKNNRGSRFKLYLAGELTGQWWKESTKLADDN